MRSDLKNAAEQFIAWHKDGHDSLKSGMLDYFAEIFGEALASLSTPPDIPKGAVEVTGYRIDKDGDQWCAVGPDFIDLQQSPAGFADTPGEALEALMKAFGKEWAAKNGDWVKRHRLPPLPSIIPEGTPLATAVREYARQSVYASEAAPVSPEPAKSDQPLTELFEELRSIPGNEWHASQPAEAVTDAQIDAMNRAAQDQAISSGIPPHRALARAILALAATPVAAPSVTIDFRQATELLEMFGDEPTEITLMTGDGHSGNGLYAVYNADPEGAVFLGETDEEATPVAAQPADCGICKGDREACDPHDCGDMHRAAAVEPANLSACNFCLDQARQAREEVAKLLSLLEDWVTSFADSIEGGEADELVKATRAALATIDAEGIEVTDKQFDRLLTTFGAILSAASRAVVARKDGEA